jgi:hypothetical protein
MKKYTVNITYTASANYEVEAENKEQAEEKAWALYDHADLDGSSDVGYIDEDETEEVTK